VPETVPAYTSAQVRAAEKPLLEAGEPLMHRAAGALAAIARRELGEAGRRVLVLAGGGDNGGDALFAGAELAEVADIEVDVLLTSDRAHVAGLGAAIAAGARKVDLPAVIEAAADYDLVLDGILGIGASADAALRGTARTVVDALLPAVRAGRPRVVAVDLPSGLHPDAGTADDAVLPASLTVTFGAVKTGLVTAEGPKRTGRLVLVDIGLGPGLAAVDPAGEASVDEVIAG
jgi:NAD(P)H-hydrate epimerase